MKLRPHTESEASDFHVLKLGMRYTATVLVTVPILLHHNHHH
jgi:hypothetical protein